MRTYNLKTINQFKLEFPNLDIIHYVNTKKVYIRTLYGIHKCNIQDLRNNHKPKIQTSINKSQYFINKYEDVNYRIIHIDYKNQYSTLKCYCKEHGLFKIKAKSYKKGVRCVKCSNKNKGWSNKKYDKNFNKFCTFYILKLSNKSEKFFKIGITSNNIKYRYSLSLKYYDYEILYKRNTNYVSALHLESNLIKYHSKEAYIPKHKFDGYTECFSKIKLLL